MRKNDAGLTILERYDVVRIGKGKVEYTVLSDVVTADAHIESKNTGKSQTVAADRLTLVRDIRTVPEVSDELKAEVQNMIDEAKEEPVEETSAYAKAVLFALNKLQKHVYAGTVSDKTKGKRRSLGRRQKASRKANR